MNLDEMFSLTPRTNYVTQKHSDKVKENPKMDPKVPAAMPLPKPKQAPSPSVVSDPIVSNKLESESVNAVLGKPNAVNTDPSPTASPTTGNESRLSGAWKEAAKYALIGGIPTLFGALFGEAGIGASVGGKVIEGVRKDEAARDLASMKQTGKAGVVNMISPDGNLETVPESQAQAYAQQGYKLTTAGHLISDMQIKAGEKNLELNREKFVTQEARRQGMLELQREKHKFTEDRDYLDRVKAYGKDINSIGYHVNKERIETASRQYDTVFQRPEYKDKKIIPFASYPGFQDSDLKKLLQDTVTLGYEYLTGQSGAQFSAKEMANVFTMLGIPTVSNWQPSDVLDLGQILDSIRYIDKEQFAGGLHFMDRVLDAKARSIRAAYPEKAIGGFEDARQTPSFPTTPAVVSPGYKTNEPISRSGQTRRSSTSSVLQKLRSLTP